MARVQLASRLHAPSPCISYGMGLHFLVTGHHLLAYLHHGAGGAFIHNSWVEQVSSAQSAERVYRILQSPCSRRPQTACTPRCRGVAVFWSGCSQMLFIELPATSTKPIRDARLLAATVVSSRVRHNFSIPLRLLFPVLRLCNFWIVATLCHNTLKQRGILKKTAG